MCIHHIILFCGRTEKTVKKTPRLHNKRSAIDRLTAQIGFFDGGGVQQLGTGAGSDDLTGFQNVAAIGNLQRGTGILFHQQDGGAVFVQLLDDVKNLFYQDA